jgi:hypothetical protein
VLGTDGDWSPCQMQRSGCGPISWRRRNRCRTAGPWNLSTAPILKRHNRHWAARKRGWKAAVIRRRAPSVREPEVLRCKSESEPVKSRKRWFESSGARALETERRRRRGGDGDEEMGCSCVPYYTCRYVFLLVQRHGENPHQRQLTRRLK